MNEHDFDKIFNSMERSQTFSKHRFQDHVFQRANINAVIKKKVYTDVVNKFLERLKTQGIDDPSSSFHLVGGVRRELEYVPMIKVLYVCPNNWEERTKFSDAIVNSLDDIYDWDDVIGTIDSCVMQVLYCNPENLGPAKLFLTGPNDFVNGLKELAYEKGFYLTKSGLRDVKECNRVDDNTEESIFKALGVSYVPPKQRR